MFNFSIQTKFMVLLFLFIVFVFSVIFMMAAGDVATPLFKYSGISSLVSGTLFFLLNESL